METLILMCLFGTTPDEQNWKALISCEFIKLKLLSDVIHSSSFGRGAFYKWSGCSI